MSDYYKYEVFRLPISKTPLCVDELEDVVCGVKCDLGKFEIVYTEDEVCLDLVVKELSGDGEYGFSRELLDEERVPIQMCFDAIPDLAGHYNLSDVHCVVYSYYNCSEPPFYYEVQSPIRQ